MKLQERLAAHLCSFISQDASGTLSSASGYVSRSVAELRGSERTFTTETPPSPCRWGKHIDWLLIGWGVFPRSSNILADEWFPVRGRSLSNRSHLFSDWKQSEFSPRGIIYVAQISCKLASNGRLGCVFEVRSASAWNQHSPETLTFENSVIIRVFVCFDSCSWLILLVLDQFLAPLSWSNVKVQSSSSQQSTPDSRHVHSCPSDRLINQSED